ncbi:MAG TPA: sigma factor, partial [Tahibacter sp.]|nr:sigma factor [Tahibacter sp.]
MAHDIDIAIAHDFRAAQCGDRAAFARLVAATQRLVTGVALAITADVASSEDVAQDTFLAAWRHLALMRNPASFLPWLRQV